MGRKARFTKNDFIEAALELLAEKGLSGVTMANIAEKSGAPIGSVYHRFESREILLAELWVTLIESLQPGFLEALDTGKIQNAALYPLKWARRNPHQAKVLLLYQREQLVTGDWPDMIKERVEAQKKEMNDGILKITQQLLGKATEKNIDRVVFCLIDVPVGAVRSCLEQGRPISEVYDELVGETCQALLGEKYLV